MYRIAFLGCENSHANNFLSQIIEQGMYPDVEVVGVYSNEPAAAEKLREKYGVAVADAPDAFVGKVDGLVITARDGIYHYPYAKPYIESGIPMFIDKPITSDDEEAVAFMKALRANGVRVTGGSSCIRADDVIRIKGESVSEEGGKILAGTVRAPLQSASPYGGFFFYAQHLVQIAQEIFGYYPASVRAYKKGDILHATLAYEGYDVSCIFTDNSYSYSIAVHREKGTNFGDVKIDAVAFEREFKEFYALLCGEEQKQSYRDFIAPVFVMTAIKRALDSGKEEAVFSCEEI